MQQHHRIETPMPRSAQMRAAAAAAAAGGGASGAMMMEPYSPVGSMSAAGARSFPRRIPSNTAIDYGKYKTKMCRNYLNGMQCPFESRCVFAHGEEQISADSAVGSHESSMIFDRPPQSATSLYGYPSAGSLMDFPSPGHESVGTTSPSSEDEAAAAAAAFAAMAPPSYTAFLQTAVDVNAVDGAYAPAINVSRPRRHDPYNPCVFGYGYIATY